jgi:hypothetical protein
MNKAIRIIFGLLPRDTTTFYLNHFNLHTVERIIRDSVIKFIYANTNQRIAHPLIRDQIDHTFGGSYQTRARTDGELFVPAFNTEQRRKTVFVSGIRSYNRLPIAIRSASTMGTFKKRLAKI